MRVEGDDFVEGAAGMVLEIVMWEEGKKEKRRSVKTENRLDIVGWLYSRQCGSLRCHCSFSIG